MKAKDTDYKLANEINLVAVTAPRPTRWEVFFILVLWALFILGMWVQYSYVAQGRRLREEIPQIVVTVTATMQAEGHW